jgi:putative endonuclease
MALRFWVYILLCRNGHYYTGYTTDLNRRYQEHLTGTDKCKYTRSFKPERLAQCWEVRDSKTLALQIEAFIKKLPKKKKEALISNPKELTEHFSCQVGKFKLKPIKWQKPKPGK